MKSNVCVFKKSVADLNNILLESDKIAQYNNLAKKESLRLRLLAEEMVALLSELVEKFEGEFYIENNNNQYELHAEIKIPTMTSDVRKELIAFSSQKKNSASKGILGKIRNAFDVMMINFFENESLYVVPTSVGGEYNYNYNYEWSLRSYVNSCESKKEIDDELQKSIIGSVADNVVVAIKGGKVSIVITKEFN